MLMKILPKNFYKKDPTIVAKKLLGKFLVRFLNSKTLIGKIVETEAYYSKDDPAFRKDFLSKIIKYTLGTAFIYMVHANWLLNIIAYKEIFGGVLIRSIEPIKGIEEMMKNRGIKDISKLTNGPGKLTKALKITKDLNGIDVSKKGSKLIICSYKKENFEIKSSHRIGVKKDLEKKLRFFIKGNAFISK